MQLLKAKYHYDIWFEAGTKLVEAGRRPVRSQIPLRYLVRSWFDAGRRQVRSWSATSFEPDSVVMEFGRGSASLC